MKPTVFTITKEEVEEMFEEVKEEDDVEEGATLTHKQTEKILEYVECDEMLAKDIRTSIRGSIRAVLEETPFPKHACQHCGSERKFVETIIDDEFYWNEDEKRYEPKKFTNDFEHTGEERCAECGEKWTGA